MARQVAPAGEAGGPHPQSGEGIISGAKASSYWQSQERAHAPSYAHLRQRGPLPDTLMSSSYLLSLSLYERANIDSPVLPDDHEPTF